MPRALRAVPRATFEDLDAALDHLDARPDCRALAVVGLPVDRLVRVRLGPLHLGRLPSGTWRTLAAEEVACLQRMLASAEVGGNGEKRAGRSDNRS
jgi:hypothetical protein